MVRGEGKGGGSEDGMGVMGVVGNKVGRKEGECEKWGNKRGQDCKSRKRLGLMGCGEEGGEGGGGGGRGRRDVGRA